jgi:hypothetical protein
MNKKLYFILSLVLIGIASRFLFITNFTAIGAVAILSGSMLRRPLESFAMPLVVLMLSDLILNKFVYHVDGLFYAGAAYVYGPILLMTLVSRLVKTMNVTKYVGLSLLFTVVFFLVSNYGVWQSGLSYPLTAQGLMACYIAAIPFVLNSLAGTLLFGGAILFAYNALTQQRSLEFAKL